MNKTITEEKNRFMTSYKLDTSQNRMKNIPAYPLAPYIDPLFIDI